MEVLGGGLKITIQNTLKRLGSILIWLIKSGGKLLLKLPLASVKLLARIGGYVLDRKNRKIMMLILATAGLVIASRTLVN